MGLHVSYYCPLLYVCYFVLNLTMHIENPTLKGLSVVTN